MSKFKRILPWILLVLLVATRFVNLSWGLPYPFHPDERNIAEAIVKLSASDLFKPTFYAYGQFSIYLAYLLVRVGNIATGRWTQDVTFEQAVLALRLLSSLASLGVVYFGVKIARLFYPSSRLIFFPYLLLIFSPALIQFAHFGTTESLLMMFYTAITYFSIKTIDEDSKGRARWLHINAFLVGLAAATKISSLSFALLPAVTFLISQKSFRPLHILKLVGHLVMFGLVLIVTLVIFSPYNFLNAKDFIGAFNYESDVALGRSLVFYTRQFLYSIPMLFQFVKIFPYTLGWPVDP